MGEVVIECAGLQKSYGDVHAINGLDLSVGKGEIFAILGPNGAGKTSTVEVLEGFRSRDGGDVRVLGEDPAHAKSAWRSRIGIVLQDSKPQTELTVTETLARYGSYYPSPREVDEVLSLVSLSDRADRRAGRLSGGELRRLDVGIALMGRPEVLFLDEPTTGFDPEARRMAWSTISALRDQGVTVLLTTHYMEEASVLADRVAIVVDGKVQALGTPNELVGDRPTRITWRSESANWPNDVVRDGDSWLLESDDVAKRIASLVSHAESTGAQIEDLQAIKPTLEDAYLRLVGEAHE